MTETYQSRTLEPTTFRTPAAWQLQVVEDNFVPRWDSARWTLRTVTRRWLAAHGLVPPELAAEYRNLLRYTDLVAGYYHHAAVPALQAISDFSVWFFLWDDRHGVLGCQRRERRWQTFITQLRHAAHRPEQYRGHPDPLVSGFANSFVRLVGNIGPSWDARFIAHMERVFDAYDQEFRNVLTATVPTVEDYLRLRRWTFGHDVWIDLLELAAGQELPAEIRQNALYRRVAYASQEFSSTYNDLYSLGKEIAAGEIHNLGISLMRHRGFNRHEAETAICGRATDCVNRFLRTEEELSAIWESDRWPRKIQLATRSCVSNMRNWVSAVYWFHHESGRYKTNSWADPAHPPYVVSTSEDAR